MNGLQPSSWCLLAAWPVADASLLSISTPSAATPYPLLLQRALTEGSNLQSLWQDKSSPPTVITIITDYLC